MRLGQLWSSGGEPGRADRLGPPRVGREGLYVQETPAAPAPSEPETVGQWKACMFSSSVSQLRVLPPLWAAASLGSLPCPFCPIHC